MFEKAVPFSPVILHHRTLEVEIWIQNWRVEGDRPCENLERANLWQGGGRGKMSSCDCLRGGKRMWKIHLEGWYHKRLSGGSKIASQAKGRKTSLLSMAITLTLLFPTPTLARPHLNYWLLSDTPLMSRAVNTRVNDIYYFNNFQRNKESSS